MLERVLRHIHNRFERTRLSGTFEVSGGALPIEGALEGQYFWVEGSVLNDGLHLYPDSTMADETFEGRVYLLAVPRELVELSETIAAWVEDNSGVLDSPYQSESFGGYSYTRADLGTSSGGSRLEGWQARYRVELDPYRKMHGAW